MPPDFTRRSTLPELMEGPCSFEEFRDCLHDLAQVNIVTLACRPTLAWLDKLQAAYPGQPLHIVDVGCGYGDMLRRIGRWAARRGVAVTLTGIDLNPHAARAAREVVNDGASIEWVTADAYSWTPATPVDAVISSLFTHHLPDAEIVRFLEWMERVVRCGWFINDLRRHKFPYYGFAVLAWLMRWHRFVRHDGPVSIARGFGPADWRKLLAAAHITVATIEGQFPFRLCIGRIKP